MNKIREFISGFKKGTTSFGENLATIVNSVLLTFVYLVGIGLTSLAAKLFKKSFLDLEPKKDSYWTDLNLGKKPTEEYYRQF